MGKKDDKKAAPAPAPKARGAKHFAVMVRKTYDAEFICAHLKPAGLTTKDDMSWEDLKSFVEKGGHTISQYNAPKEEKAEEKKKGE